MKKSELKALIKEAVQEMHGGSDITVFDDIESIIAMSDVSIKLKNNEKLVIELNEILERLSTISDQYKSGQLTAEEALSKIVD